MLVNDRISLLNDFLKEAMIVTMSCCLPFLFAFEKASSMISREIECFFLADLSLPWFGFNRSLSMGGIVFKISQNWVDN